MICLCFAVYSAREIGKGDEVAWYADGDYTVRNEFNSDISYGFGISLLSLSLMHTHLL